VVLLQPPQRLDHPVIAIAPNRPALLGAVGFQLGACDPLPFTPAAAPQNRTAQHRRLEIDLQLLRFGLGVVICGASVALSQPAFRVGQRLAAGVGVAQLLGQLIPAIVAVELVLAPVSVFGFAQDVLDQAAVAAVLVHRRVRFDLRRVDRDHPDRHQPRLPTKPKDIVEQRCDLGLMTATELRDRRVIGRAQAGDHLERDVLLTGPLDPA
jgi:hypothetical protein